MTREEAYDNAKEIKQAKNILNTQDEIFRKLKNRSRSGSAFGDINEVRALDKISDYDH